MTDRDRPTAELEAAERALFERFELDVESRRLSVGRPAMSVRALESGSGKPLVLIHGGGSVAASWVPLMAELGARRCIAVDRPGCGATDPFDYTGVDLRGHAIEFLGGVLDALGLERADLVANSMGGLWSVWFALEHPELVRSLALVGAPAAVLGTSAPLPMRLLGVRGLNRALMGLGSSPPQTRRFLRMVLGEPAAKRMTPEFVEVSHAAELVPGAKDAWRSLLEGVVGLRGATVDLSEAELRRLATPVLLVWGAHDACADVDVARRAQRAIPDARLKVLDAGHAPWWDDQRVCGELVSEFLDDVPGAVLTSLLP